MLGGKIPLPRTGGAPERADRIVGGPRAAVKAGARLTVVLSPAKDLLSPNDSRTLSLEGRGGENVLMMGARINRCAPRPNGTSQLLGLIVNPSPTNNVDG